MKLTIKDAAKKYLEKFADSSKTLLISADDGSTKYSKLGGTCAIGDKFQVVVLTAPDPDYTIALTNNAGYQVFMSDIETPFLGHGLTLDFTHNSLVLKDDSGILDGAVSVFKDADNGIDITKEDQVALSQKNC